MADAVVDVPTPYQLGSGVTDPLGPTKRDMSGGFGGERADP